MVFAPRLAFVTFWLLALAAVVDLIKRLVFFWGGIKARREKGQQDNLVDFDWFRLALYTPSCSTRESF